MKLQKASEVIRKLTKGGTPTAFAESFVTEQIAAGTVTDDRETAASDDDDRELAGLAKRLGKLAKAHGKVDVADESDDGAEYGDGEDDDEDDDEDDEEGEPMQDEPAPPPPRRGMKKGHALSEHAQLSLDGDGQVVQIISAGADRIARSFEKSSGLLAESGIVQIKAVRGLRKSISAVDEKLNTLFAHLRLPLPARSTTTLDVVEQPGEAERKRMEKSHGDGAGLRGKVEQAINREQRALAKSNASGPRQHQLTSAVANLDSGADPREIMSQFDIVID